MTIQKGKEVLWLSEDDVAGLIGMADALEAMTEAFTLHGQGAAQMPVKVYLTFDGGGDLRAMPAYLKAPVNAAGVKIVNSNPANPDRGLPAVAGIMVYVDPETGLPLALFGAAHLTSLPTGAAGGVAARALARPESRAVGLIGCGRQARTQLEALRHYFTIERVLVWGKTLEEAQAFCAAHPGPGLQACASIEEACRADILVTTTPARSPVVKAAWVGPGTHINAIGADAPGKQELETRLVKTARVVVDEWHQASHAGEINVPVTEGALAEKDIAGQLGEILVGARKGRADANEVTIFDSTGLAIQDVALSRRLFEKAVQLRKGQVLKLHG